MNYHKPEIIEHLARQHVLNLLKGGARTRFERMLANDTQMQAEVRKWDTLLGPVLLGVPEVEAPKQTWSSISTRLWGDPEKNALNKKLFWWKSIAFAASFASIALMVPLLQTFQSTQLDTRFITIIQDEDKSPRWLVKADETTSELYVEQLNPSPIASDKDLELWLIGPDDAPPISLGLLNQEELITLNIDQDLFANAVAVAVSLEPAGGSPTGLPTGPVLYQGVF